MSNTAGGDARLVAMEIARYLRAHPDAADTLEGAATWWLRRQLPIDVMERAMRLLEEVKVVERHILPGNRVIFRSGPGLASFNGFPPIDLTRLSQGA